MILSKNELIILESALSGFIKLRNKYGFDVKDYKAIQNKIKNEIEFMKTRERSES